MMYLNYVPEFEREYCEAALAMYEGGWRSTDRQQMIDELVNGEYACEDDRMTEEEVDIIIDILERYEAHLSEKED